MLVYQLRAAVQIARKLGASLLDLIEPQGLFFLFLGEQRAQVAKQHPSQYGDGRPGKNDEKPDLRKLHKRYPCAAVNRRPVLDRRVPVA
jgi:hypothetical protein